MVSNFIRLCKHFIDLWNIPTTTPEQSAAIDVGFHDYLWQHEYCKCAQVKNETFVDRERSEDENEEREDSK